VEEKKEKDTGNEGEVEEKKEKDTGNERERERDREREREIGGIEESKRNIWNGMRE